MSVNKTLHAMDHGGVDPREALLAKVGAQAVEDFTVSGFQVLVGAYVRPKTTAKGFMQRDADQEEDQWQGKIGLILKTGPLAFYNEEMNWPEGSLPQVGDWAVLRVHDGTLVTINGHTCRLLESKQIRGTVKDPDSVI